MVKQIKKWLPFNEYVKNITCSKCGNKGHYANKCVSTVDIKKLDVSNFIIQEHQERNEIFYEDVISDSINNCYIKPLKLKFILEDIEVFGLIDTGASNTVISANLMSQIDENWIQNTTDLPVYLAAGKQTDGKIKSVSINYGGIQFIHKVIILYDLNDDMIVGRDLIYYLNLPTKHGLIKPNNESLVNEFVDEKLSYNEEIILNAIKQNYENTVNKISLIQPLELKLINKDVKSWKKQYRLIPSVFDAIIEETIEDWIKNDIIEISLDNNFNSSILTVPKKNDCGIVIENVRRVCLDYQHINNLIVDETNDIPNIWDIFEIIGNALIFSCIDLLSAYLQVGLNENSRPYTSFTYKNKRYQFKRIPFGLKVAPSFFQRSILNILQIEGCSSFCINYFDDLIVYSNSIIEHEKHVLKLIEVLTKYDLTIKAEKCKLFKKKMILLGFVISQNNIEINLKRVVNVDQWDRPCSKKSMQKFIGFVNYFRNFIPKFPDLLWKFQQLLSGEQEIWEWNEELEFDYKKIHDALINSLILRRVNYDHELCIASDASDHGIGAILFQVIDGKTYYNSIVARSLKNYEKRYSIPKRETLAVVFAFKKFKIFILGRRFILFCDNESLTYSLKEYSNLGWFDVISEFNFETRHIKGIDNILPDKLSRLFTDDNKKVMIYKLDIINDENEISKWLEKAHLFGHFGGESMKRFLLWKGIKFTNMKNKCIQFVKSCSKCQNWSNSKPKFSPLSSVFAKKIWDHICIDLIGPLPRSSHEFNYIWICVDVLSRFVLLKPLQSKSAINSASLLCESITTFGVPKIIQSDQGSEFVNDTISELKKLIGFDHRLTTPYVSFQNGLVERHVQTVSNAIKKLTCESVNGMENWHQILGAIQFSINCRFTSIHQIQPFYLMFGREPNIFDDFSKSQLIEEGEEETIKKILNHWTFIYEKVYPNIKLKMKDKQKEMISRYNDQKKVSSSVKGNEFKKGDIVRYKNIKRSSKWEKEFLGPYMIKSVNKRTGNYTLCEINDKEYIVANNIPAHWIRKTNEN